VRTPRYEAGWHDVRTFARADQVSRKLANWDYPVVKPVVVFRIAFDCPSHAKLFCQFSFPGESRNAESVEVCQNPAAYFVRESKDIFFG
jgi:hypothetical protein